MAAPAASDVKFNYKDASGTLPPEVQEMFQALDVDGKGSLSKQEVLDLVAAAQRQRPSGSAAASSIMVQDLGLSGKRVTTADMAKVHTSVKHMQAEQQTYRRLICGMVVALIVLATATFGVCFAAVELAKETHVRDDNTIRVSSGETALIGSADTMVVDGTLVSRLPADQGVCNNSTGSCSPHALATRPAQEHRSLSSRIANEVFESLDSVSFSFSGDGSSRVAFKVHGFARARSSRSEHGTVVHLDLLKGTLTLDGSNIYFDNSLALHLESLGVLVAGQRVYAHGRRLQDGQAVVTGIFSIFDDWEFHELPDTLEKPRTPTLPYAMTVLERRTCKTVEACQSKFIDGEFLPGYDAETNSIMTRVHVIETEAWAVKIARLPNHPTQQLLTYADHTAQTKRLIQFASVDFPTNCVNENYTAEPSVLDLEDEWYVTYVGDVEREAAEYEVWDEIYTVNRSTNRFFHLIHRNASLDTPDEEATMHFEDDSATLLMKRAFLPNAAAEDWKLQEVIVVALEEIDNTYADSLRSHLSELLACGMNETDNTMESDVPVVDEDDAHHETLNQLLFYVEDLIESGSVGLGSYWRKAVAEVDSLQQLLESQKEAFLARGTTTNSSGDERRLRGLRSDDADDVESRELQWLSGHKSQTCLSPPSASSSHKSMEICFGVTVPFDRNSCPGCGCSHFSITSSHANKRGTGWYGTGTVRMGDYCSTPGAMGFGGSLTIGYEAGTLHKHMGVTVGCTIGASGTGTVRQFTLHVPVSHGEYMGHLNHAWNYQQGKCRRLQQQENETNLEEEELFDSDAHEVRRLWGGRLPSNPERRLFRMPKINWGQIARACECTYDCWRKGYDANRRRLRPQSAADFSLTIGAGGGCEAAGLGFRINGHMTFQFGPFPKPYFVPKSEGKAGFNVCVKVVFTSFCIDIFRATLWSEAL